MFYRILLITNMFRPLLRSS